MMPVKLQTAGGGAKPVYTASGELPMFEGPLAPLIVPETAQVMPEPARIPKAAADLSGESGGGGGMIAVTVTVAVPETAPLVAWTVLAKKPAEPPDVNRPELLMVPPLLMTDQTGAITKTFPPASFPTATNCCGELGGRVTGFGVTVILASGPVVTMTVAKPDSPPAVARTVLVNVPDTRSEERRVGKERRSQWL